MTKRYRPRAAAPVAAALALAAALTGRNPSRSLAADPQFVKGEQAITGGTPLTLTPAAGQPVWDLGNRESLAITLRNSGPTPVTVEVRAENAEAIGMKDTVRTFATIPAKTTREITLRLVRRPEDPTYAPLKPYFMYTKTVNVRDNTIDPSDIARVVVSIDKGSVTLKSLRAIGDGKPGPVAFFPFIDAYGQYVHSDWPGKIHSDAEFAARTKQEDEEMRAYPGPADWDKWGGWATGPKLTATGHFTTAKQDGKWWLVDPDGRLFFSYGPTGVGFGEGTPISDRENWFAALPPQDGSPLSRYYGQGKGATYMYYKDKSYQTYDFSAAAAERKYGPDWRNISSDRLNRRLRNWGFNTLGNWSSMDVAARHQTPYVVAIHYGGPWLYRMPDAYTPAFEQALRDRLAKEKGKSAGDPWCLGYFVDNELWWGPGQHGENVAESVLKAAPDSASKQVLLTDLKAKYGGIDKLNTAWGTAYASWDALQNSQTLPEGKKTDAYHADCGDFGLKFADHYFSTVRRLVKEVAPDNLYLGSRFHGHIDTPLVQIAAKYVDVLSWNVYEPRPGDRLNRFLGVIDKPFIVGEFGVGSDPLETPLRGSDASEDPFLRAGQMQQYLRAAFVHPLLVGAHYFQFRDQPLSGRSDGEATLRGFVDTTDTPHFDLVQANRQLAYNLYALRSGSSKPQTEASSAAPQRQ